MEIELCGYKVQIDEDDYERVIKEKWYLNKGSLNRNSVYFQMMCYPKDHKRYIISFQRFIMKCVYKDGVVVDHINGDTLDNRKCNLRKCTSAENTRNQKLSKINTVGLKGVTHSKISGKYIAQISVNWKNTYLGVYKTAEEAHAAYCEASKKYHGDFGRTE